MQILQHFLLIFFSAVGPPQCTQKYKVEWKIATLKQDVPNLILIRCVCHSLQLAISKASETLPRNIEFLIKETYS
jgi:hypothetical protein